MYISKFLLTSALYLSLGGAGVALADDDRDKDQRRAATGTVHVVGNDKLRFTITERNTLDRYFLEEKSRRAVAEAHGEQRDRDRGDHDDQGKGRDGHKHKSLPPGLQKKVARGESLPPGWQKKLARGEVLPVTVYSAGRPLPPELRRQLPKDPPGTVTIEVDGEVLRVLQDTRQIIDILRGHR